MYPQQICLSNLSNFIHRALSYTWNWTNWSWSTASWRSSPHKHKMEGDIRRFLNLPEPWYCTVLGERATATDVQMHW